MKSLLVFAAALPMAFQAVAAADTFSGSWPLIVSHSSHADGNYCLTLNDDGSLGWPHSGEASLVSQVTGSLPYGTFQVINHQLLVTIEQQGLTGQNAGLVFVAPAGKTGIGKGVYEQVYGGGDFDSGVVVFGAKGGC